MRGKEDKEGRATDQVVHSSTAPEGEKVPTSQMTHTVRPEPGAQRCPGGQATGVGAGVGRALGAGEGA